MQRNFTAATGARAGRSAESETLLFQQRAALRARLAHSKDGSIACSVENCVLILENDPLLMGAIRKNLFTGCIQRLLPPCSSFMFHHSKVRIILTYTPKELLYDENELRAVRRTPPSRH